MHRVDRHDVRVLKLGQGPRLIVDAWGHLQDHRPVCQVVLLSKVDPSKGPMAKLRKQAESQ